jgi:hypothetical protein
MRLVKWFLLAGLFLLVPAPARAWGPAAHLDFGLIVLSDLALLAPAVAALLKKFPDDFLYGSIAADITVGKNLSPYHLHCHNWQVGFSVLDLAGEECTRAFAWGYLSHLAADVVAHNYFIPYKIVQHYTRRRAPHAYWEVRFDTRVQRETWKTVKALSAHTFRAHDQHLRKILTAPLFPFRINKQLFNSMVLFNHLIKWKRMVDAHARRSKMLLTQEEIEEMHRLSVEKVMDLLTHCQAAGCLAADPTGHRNILIARDIRKRLRQLNLQGRLLDPQTIGDRYRPLFREAMESKLTLPSMMEMIHPSPPPKENASRIKKLRTRISASRERRRQRRSEKKAGQAARGKPRRRLLRRKKK